MIFWGGKGRGWARDFIRRRRCCVYEIIIHLRRAPIFVDFRLEVFSMHGARELVWRWVEGGEGGRGAEREGGWKSMG